MLLKQDGMKNSGMNSPIGLTVVIVNGTYSSPHLYQLHMQHFRSLSIPYAVTAIHLAAWPGESHLPSPASLMGLSVPAANSIS